MDARSVEHFVQFFLSPPSPLEDGELLGCTACRLLVSGRGVGLHKNGFGCPSDLRTVGIGDGLRRIAERCITLQSKGNNAASVDMSHELQCGVGIQGGVDSGYAILNRSMGALVKANIPSSVLITGAGNACGSIMQDAIHEELLESRPDLVGFWSACYGGNE